MNKIDEQFFTEALEELENIERGEFLTYEEVFGDHKYSVTETSSNQKVTLSKTKQPNPGHSEATKLGCTCPVLDNNHGIGCGKDEKGQTRFWIREDCPMHGLVAQIQTNKLRYRECYWTGKEPEALKAANPFRVDELVYGCPECREISTLIKVCDEPSCRRDVSCGFMQSNGAYRQTCSKHYN